jgi:diguanylate cyclase (GGDEF)-like protein
MLNEDHVGSFSGAATSETGGTPLQDVLLSEKLRDHLAVLADTIGFKLSVYFSTGRLIAVPGSPFPPCNELHAMSSECGFLRETNCHSAIMSAITKKTHKTFTCAAKKMINFAAPIEYMNEKAVILGYGAFSSYQDYRDYANMMRSREDHATIITVPQTFISRKQARQACYFVTDSVSRLLKYIEENVSLKKKMEMVTDVFGKWNASPDDGPSMLFRFITDKLFSLLDISCITLLTLDKEQGKYTSIHRLKRSTEKALVQNISDKDVIVKDLLGGKQYVLFKVPRTDRHDDSMSRTRAWYFFPVMVNSSLEAILAISDQTLKEADINIISALCRHAALLIENQRLQRDVSHKVKLLAVASALPESITNHLEYRALLETILDKSAELLMAEQGSLMLIDKLTEELLVEVKKGIGDAVPEKLAILKGEGIAGKVAVLGEPFLVKNLEEDPRFKQKNKQHYKTPSFVSVPLKLEERIIGVLNLSDKTTGEVFDDEDLKLIQMFADHAAIILDRKSLYNQTKELKRLSITDPLTGLLNRRYLQDRLEEELSRTKRHERNMCLLMIDLDGFKFYNDTYGHLTGDRILKHVADVIMKSFRTMDVVSRYGGDEFMVILPETDLTLASKIAERLNNDITNEALLAESSIVKSETFITASIGIVSYPQHGETTAQLLENVDKAMYCAKHEGRHKIKVL